MTLPHTPELQESETNWSQSFEQQSEFDRLISEFQHQRGKALPPAEVEACRTLFNNTLKPYLQQAEES